MKSLAPVRLPQGPAPRPSYDDLILRAVMAQTRLRIHREENLEGGGPVGHPIKPTGDALIRCPKITLDKHTQSHFHACGRAASQKLRQSRKAIRFPRPLTAETLPSFSTQYK